MGRVHYLDSTDDPLVLGGKIEFLLRRAERQITDELYSLRERSLGQSMILRDLVSQHRNFCIWRCYVSHLQLPQLREILTQVQNFLRQIEISLRGIRQIRVLSFVPDEGRQ